MVLAPEHPLVAELTTPAQREAVAAYQAQARRKSDLERTDLAKEKTGVFTGATARNPVNGREIPIWIADYVLATYGTGAIMAVPAHDERDFAFAKKFGLPIVTVVAPGRRAPRRRTPTPRSPATGSPSTRARSTGCRRPRPRRRSPPRSRRPAPASWRSATGCATGSSRASATGASRSRSCTARPTARSPCPSRRCRSPCPTSSATRRPAPANRRWRRSRAGSTPPARPAAARRKRETNTMPQWAGSCWYYLRYLDPSNGERAVRSATVEKKWMPVDLYVGGAEHAVLHLLYARFWHKVLFDMGVVSTPEPFKKLRHQGTVLARSYEDAMGRYHEVGEIEFRGDAGDPARDRRDAEGDRREDGQEQDERRQPRRRHPRLRRRRHAPVRDVHGRVRAAQALGPARHRGGEPLHQARLAAGRGVRCGEGARGHRRSAREPAPQDDQARHRRPRADAVQHRRRRDDGVRQRADRQGRRARRPGHAGQARRPLRAPPRRRGVGAPGREGLPARGDVAGPRRGADAGRDGHAGRAGRRQGARLGRDRARRQRGRRARAPRWRSPTSASTSRAARSASSSTSPAASSASCRRPPADRLARAEGRP